MKKTGLSIFLLMPLLLSACHNMRWYEKDQARFWCNLWSKPKGSDYNILMLAPTNSLRNGAYDLSIKLNDGTVIDLRQPDVARITQMSGRHGPASTAIIRGHPDAYLESRIESYHFVFSKSNLLSFSARYFKDNAYYKTNRACISSSLTTNWFYFPLSEDQVREVIGDPDKIYDFWIN